MKNDVARVVPQSRLCAGTRHFSQTCAGYATLPFRSLKHRRAITVCLALIASQSFDAWRPMNRVGCRLKVGTRMWKFFKHEPGRTLVDPIEEAFFSTDSDEANARHLVRESIQNSLDARHNQQPVRVRFTFGELGRRDAQEFFGSLEGHLTANNSGLLDPPSVSDSLRFLAIEDFGTTGLSGDPSQLLDVDEREDENFYYFWRNVGRSGKRSGTLGKWGLGKTVFPASSGINTFFGLTCRPGDNATYLLGRCDLKTHQIDGQQYDPYGYFADWHGTKPMAITDATRIERVRHAFHLARSGSGDTPGLSIIIPHVIDEFSVEMLRQEVIENYFWPVLKGDLVIEVQENYLTPPETVINRDWMQQAVNSPNFRQKDRELADTISLAAWANDHKSPTINLPTGRVATPSWDDVELSEADVNKLIDCELDGVPFSIRVPLWVQPENGDPRSATFHVYCHRVPYPTRRRSYFVRQGIYVRQAGSRNPAQRVCLIVVEQGSLADLLGDAENPSHTNFVRTTKVRQLYRHGAMTTINFVKNSPVELIRKLDVQDDDSAGAIIAGFFPKVQERQEINARKRRVPVNQGESATPTVEVIATPKPILFNQVSNGFHIKDNAQSLTSVDSINIKAGFKGNRGNPFKNHSRFDFDFANPEESGLNFEANGCIVDVLSPNEVRLTNLEDTFDIRIDGFDVHRDLQVQVIPRTTRQ